MAFAGNDCRQRRTAEVLPFRMTRVSYRMGVRERIAAMDWSDAARGRGIARVVFHTGKSGDCQAEADFMLVYECGRTWSSWGVAPDPNGYEVWRTGNGITIGQYATMSAALAAIMLTD